MSTLTVEEERYAIEHLKRALKNPFAYDLSRDDVKRLREALKRHEEHLRELLEKENENEQ